MNTLITVPQHPPESIVAAPQDSNLSCIISNSLLTLIFMAAAGTFTRLGVETPIWLLIYAMTAVALIIDQQRFVISMKTCWIMFLLPLITVASTFWSEDPAYTLYASAQFIYTAIIGVWIGSRFESPVIFRTLLVAMTIGVLASVANSYLYFIEPYDQDIFYGSEQYFVGIYAQKNVLGKVIVLTCLSLLIFGVRQGRLKLVMLPVIALLIPLSEAKSVSSILVYFAMLTLPVCWWLLHAVKRKFMLILAAWIAALVCMFILVAADVAIIDDFLAGVGKDSTLTGRTYMWSVGVEVIRDYPLLGVGFRAFWQPGIFTEVQEIHNLYGELNGFHNTYIEVLVATGMVGGLAFLLGLGAVLYRCVQWFHVRRSIESLGAIYLLVATISLSFFDVIAFRQHEVFYLLLVALFATSSRHVASENSASNLTHS